MMLALVIAEAVIGIIAILFALHYAVELDRLQAKHARHGVPAQVTARHDVTREPRTVLVAVPAAAGQEVTREEWQSYLKAGRAVEPVRIEGQHAPWTGSQPALTSEMEARMEAAELDRRLYLKSHLPDYAGMTDDDIREDMRRVYASRGAVAAALMLEPPAYAPAPPFPCCRHCDPACGEPHHVACIGCQPAAAEAEAQLPQVMA